MRIDGKKIAKDIFTHLQKSGIIPGLAIILVGDDPASKSYVRQKELKTVEIGGKVTIYHLPSSTSEQKLLSMIVHLNNNPSIHGIIVQRPLPPHIDSNMVSMATDPKKDIDSFHPKSPYPMPLAAAVLRILEEICSIEHQKALDNWLKSKKIVVIGKGQTGGGPTIQMFKKMGIQPQIIDSKTQNLKSITKSADIIISTVGKPNVIRPEMLKKGVILVGVGQRKGKDGKFHGDYEENEIKDIASFYTPTPGGVGPINVAMLLKNLIRATKTKL